MMALEGSITVAVTVAVTVAGRFSSRCKSDLQKRQKSPVKLNMMAQFSRIKIKPIFLSDMVMNQAFTVVGIVFGVGKTFNVVSKTNFRIFSW